jgi:iron complex outermembrane recepter protein
MLNYRLMLTAAVCALAAPALAQEAPAPQAAQDAQTDEGNVGDIVVTATRRSEALSDVPLAVSAVTAQSLANSGASDIRALNQLSPSLLVSSTSSEAAAGGARIRGIGTVGDNPGLESSVATFVDGVYRSRAGVGLTELGAIDRIEVLRGPQGTLFGRNASAGLISIITAKPSFKFGAEGDATYGNFEAVRVGGSVTGPISETIAARLDGIYFKRDGFLKDVVSGRRINNRDRWLLRGQLLFQPSDDLSVRIIGDYAQRKEECCGATYLPGQNVTRAADGSLVFSPNSIAGLERALGGIINDNTYARQTSITPGAGYRGDVKDGGISGEINYNFGNVNLTSITAYRDWSLVRGQDADFNNLDILQRPGTDANAQRQAFKTFTQELRLQGSAFDDKLNWLVGGYFANEILTLRDNLQYGTDYTRYANCLAVAGAAGWSRVQRQLRSTPHRQLVRRCRSLRSQVTRISSQRLD